MILITAANPALLSEPSPTAMPRRRGGGLTDAPPYIQTETGDSGEEKDRPFVCMGSMCQ